MKANLHISKGTHVQNWNNLIQLMRQMCLVNSTTIIIKLLAYFLKVNSQILTNEVLVKVNSQMFNQEDIG